MSSSGNGVVVESRKSSGVGGVWAVCSGGRFGVDVGSEGAGLLVAVFVRGGTDVLVLVAPRDDALVRVGRFLGGVGRSQKGRCALVEGCGEFGGGSCCCAPPVGGVRLSVRPWKASGGGEVCGASGAVLGPVGVLGRPPLRGIPCLLGVRYGDLLNTPGLDTRFVRGVCPTKAPASSSNRFCLDPGRGWGDGCLWLLLVPG